MMEISLLIRLCIGALACFFSILLWPKTRETAWILIILGVIALYAGIVFSTLESFRLISLETVLGPGVLAVIKIIFTNLPLLLFILGFIAAIMKKD